MDRTYDPLVPGEWSEWEWDETLFAGAAAYYDRGRLPNAPGLADAFESIQDGRIYIEKLNGPLLFELKGTPAEYKKYLGDPRPFLEAMGIKLPKECRIETTIENHDWLGDHAPAFRSANGTIICNVGGGNVALPLVLQHVPARESMARAHPFVAIWQAMDKDISARRYMISARLFAILIVRIRDVNRLIKLAVHIA